MEKAASNLNNVFRAKGLGNWWAVLVLALVFAACAQPDFPALAKQFPVIEDLDREFHFVTKDLPEPIETELLSGTVRPVGKITISDNAVLLLVNDYVPAAVPSGELAGHLYVNGKKKITIPVASEYENSYRFAVLNSDLVLTTEYEIVNPDTGEEETTEETYDLKALAAE